MRTVLCGFLIMLAATAMVAADLERVLLPLTPQGEIPGAGGSLWITSLSILNRSDQAIRIVPYDWHCQILCPPLNEHPDTPPGVTFRPAIPTSAPVEGAFLFLDAAHANDVALELRTRDLSRQASSHGTEIPVVRSADFLTGTATLLGVPLEPRFRSTLRIYDVEPATHDRSVVVRVFSTNPTLQVPFGADRDSLLAETTVQLSYDRHGGEIEYPGYAFVSLPMLIDLQEGTLRIDVTPTETSARFWTFVSVTNNDTQEVTLVTPQ